MQKLRLTRRRRLNLSGSAFDRTDPQGLSPLSSLSFSPSAFHSRIAGMDIPVACVAALQLPTRAALHELDGCARQSPGSEPRRRDWALPHPLRATRPSKALMHFRGFVPVALILLQWSRVADGIEAGDCSRSHEDYFQQLHLEPDEHVSMHPALRIVSATSG